MMLVYNFEVYFFKALSLIFHGADFGLVLPKLKRRYFWGKTKKHLYYRVGKTLLTKKKIWLVHIKY